MMMRGAFFVLALSSSTLTWAQLRFDQLSACDDLSRAMRSLEMPVRSCRRPNTAIEQAMVRPLQYLDQFHYCWLISPPSEALSRFACLRTDRPDGVRALDCIAPANRADVIAYREQYETIYAQRSSEYTAAANRCPIGNRNATRAVRTLFSQIIGVVARFDLGWVLPVGRGQVGESVIVHGYANVDPQIAGDGFELEFVSMWKR